MHKLLLSCELNGGSGCGSFVRSSGDSRLQIHLPETKVHSIEWSFWLPVCVCVSASANYRNEWTAADKRVEGGWLPTNFGEWFEFITDIAISPFQYIVNGHAARPPPPPPPPLARVPFFTSVLQPRGHNDSEISANEALRWKYEKQCICFREAIAKELQLAVQPRPATNL